MTKYKIIKEPNQRISIGSFEAEAFFEGTDDGNEITMRDYLSVKIPLDCCKVISDNEAKEEEERWVLSEYGW